LQPRSRSATDDLGIDRVRETFLAYGDAAYHLADDDLPAAIDASRRALEAWEKPRGIE
jgi:hypothetical protein